MLFDYGVTLLVAVVVIGTGCTTKLEVKKSDPGDKSARIGAPYSLMFTQYDIEVMRTVTKCDPELHAMISADVKAVQARPDPLQRFTLDLNSLSSPLKASSIKVGYYDDGGIASVNASADDHSVAFISNVIGGLVKVATLVGAAGGVGGGSKSVCTQEVTDALKAASSLDSQVSAATKLVELRTDETKALNAKAAALGENVDDGTKAALSAKFDQLAAAAAKLKSLTSQMEKQLAKLTYTEVLVWPPDGSSFEVTSTMSPSLRKQWGEHLDGSDEKGEQFNVHVYLEKRGAAPGHISAPSVDPAHGIPVRLPEAGRLTVCAGAPCSPDNLPLASWEGEVLQFGDVFYLPCVSRAFGSTECSLELTEAGKLKAIGVQQKNATAEGATAAAKEGLGQVADARASQRAASTKRLEAKTAALKAEADYSNALAALAPNPLKADEDATEALKAHTTLSNAKVADIEADDALRGAIANAGNVP